MAKEYEASASATVTSTAGDAAMSIADPVPRRRAGSSTARSRSHSPSRRRSPARSPPVGAAPLTLHTYSGPASNDPLTIRFKQPISASEPLRTGAYGKTLTFTLSTTTP